MDKKEFLATLSKELELLPESEKKKTLDYYTEMIDDRIEDGMEETAAVAALETPSAIARKVLLERPLPELVKSKVSKKRSLKGWEIALIILGSPLWLIFAIAILSVVLTVFVVIWSIVVSLFAVMLALALCLPVCIAGFVLFLIRSEAPAAALTLGAGFILSGFSILGFMAVKRLSKVCVSFGKAFIKGIKSIFISKEEAL